MSDLQVLKDFLLCETPGSWIASALQHQDVLLIDHANCEKKAASTAMNLMYRYVDRTELLQKMSQLAREELLHFEQVVKIMQERNVSYRHIEPSRYASSLRQYMRDSEPDKLIDTLIIGAFIEARSCERFAALAPSLDKTLQKFYLSLLRSEARHFEDYLQLATIYADEDVAGRVAFFAEREAELISSEDKQFRFHSGSPQQ
ncbi:MAG: tRNA-(ms[2]io[6]A)-hydroxylase [Gammaproteobacteria bacterium]|nr:tRNA-(ms[2]io[6]A)-hydroxylase [Gammaproteobacteria bacterium]